MKCRRNHTKCLLLTTLLLIVVSMFFAAPLKKESIHTDSQSPAHVFILKVQQSTPFSDAELFGSFSSFSFRSCSRSINRSVFPNLTCKFIKNIPQTLLADLVDINSGNNHYLKSYPLSLANSTCSSCFYYVFTLREIII